MIVNNLTSDPASFRDPMGYVFYEDDSVFRALNPKLFHQFDEFLKSELFASLIDLGYITNIHLSKVEEDRVVYKVEKIPYITYPCEWSFEQLKDAAILTLEVLCIAIRHGYIIKDASAYNIQFLNGRPVFIDHFSFEKVDNFKYWPGYIQFCKHFLGPLAAMASSDCFQPEDFIVNLDGLSLDRCISMLPIRCLFRPTYFLHLYLHRFFVSRANLTAIRGATTNVTRGFGNINKFILFVDTLKSAILQTNYKYKKSEWSDYYTSHNYNENEFADKRNVILDWVTHFSFKKVVDLGANNGDFSRLISPFCELVVSADFDHAAICKNYVTNKSSGLANIQPIVLNLANPTPSYGWCSSERLSFLDRSSFDLALALALIHHLKITFQIPFEKIAELLFFIADYAIVEFVPFDDPQTKRIAASSNTKEYTRSEFETAFQDLFTTASVLQIASTGRYLYFFKRNTVNV